MGQKFRRNQRHSLLTNDKSQCKLKCKMPNIKLYYGEFPFWRAEVSRLALHLGKVPFENVTSMNLQVEGIWQGHPWPGADPGGGRQDLCSDWRDCKVLWQAVRVLPKGRRLGRRQDR